ncbi:MAG: TolC family protein [Vicinamibacterales bacterium]
MNTTKYYMRFVIPGTLVIASLSAGLGAQSVASGIEQLVQRAMAGAPALAAARARVEAAEGERRQAGLRPNPTAEVSRREEFGGIDNQTLVGVTVPLDLFRRDARVAVASHHVHHTALEVEAAELERAYLVRVRAAAVLGARRQLDVVTQVAQTAKSRLDLLAARAETGAGRPLDRDLADVEWRRAEAERTQWAGRLAAAEAELKAAVGITDDVAAWLPLPLEAEVKLLPAPDPPTPDDVLAARPDIRALASEEAMAAAARDLAVREGRWNLAISAGYMRRTIAMPGGRDGMNEAMVGVMVDLPWRNRQQGAVAAADATRRAVASELAQRRIDAAAEIEAALAREHAATDTVSRFQEGWLALAQRNLEVVREAWTLGDATLFDVIEEERRFLALEADYTTAMRELIGARADVRRATGVR